MEKGVIQNKKRLRQFCLKEIEIEKIYGKLVTLEYQTITRVKIHSPTLKEY